MMSVAARRPEVHALRDQGADVLQPLGHRGELLPPVVGVHHNIATLCVVKRIQRVGKSTQWWWWQQQQQQQQQLPIGTGHDQRV